MAWITELKNVLSTFLLLGSFLCWHRYLTGEAGQRHRTLLGIDPGRAGGLSEMIRATVSPAGEARSGGR